MNRNVSPTSLQKFAKRSSTLLYNVIINYELANIFNVATLLNNLIKLTF